MSHHHCTGSIILSPQLLTMVMWPKIHPVQSIYSMQKSNPRNILQLVRNVAFKCLFSFEPLVSKCYCAMRIRQKSRVPSHMSNVQVIREKRIISAMLRTQLHGIWQYYFFIIISISFLHPFSYGMNDCYFTWIWCVSAAQHWTQMSEQKPCVCVHLKPNMFLNENLILAVFWLYETWTKSSQHLWTQIIWITRRRSKSYLSTLRFFFDISSFLDFCSDVNHSTYLSFMYSYWIKLKIDVHRFLDARWNDSFGMNLSSYISTSSEDYAETDYLVSKTQQYRRTKSGDHMSFYCFV